MEERALGDQGRIEGLDAWRAVLMIAGLPVHGSFWLADAPLFAVVATISQPFRMGAFFAIAGFLTARSLAHRSSAMWLRQRIAQLGIPLLFGLTVLSPLIWLVGTHRPRGAPGALMPPFHWHHLWFLVGLILYSLTAVVVIELERRNASIGRLAAACGHRRQATRTILFTAVTSALLMVFAQALIPHRLQLSLENAPFIAGYLPVFLFGLVIGREARLGEAMMACWRGYAIALALIAATYILWFGGVHHAFAVSIADRIGDAIRFIGIALCPPIVFILVLRSALAVKRVPGMLRDLSDASYTVYLLHLPIIGLVNAQLAGVSWHPYVKYAVAIAIAGPSSYAIHRYAVRRSRTLAILFNGTIPQRRHQPVTSEAIN